MKPNPLSTRNVRIFPVIFAPRRIAHSLTCPTAVFPQSSIHGPVNAWPTRGDEKASVPFLRAALPLSRATCDCSGYRYGNSPIGWVGCSAVSYRGKTGRTARLCQLIAWGEAYTISRRPRCSILYGQCDTDSLRIQSPSAIVVTAASLFLSLDRRDATHFRTFDL